MQVEGQSRSLRTRIYIDGYNFYYGCLKGTCHKWLDLYKLFAAHVLPSALSEAGGQPVRHDLLPEAIHYFTAKIIESAAKADDSVSSQARYHTALRKLHDGRIRIVEGYYSVTEVRAPRIDENDRDKRPRNCDRVAIWKLEEKQSDVNLALHAYHDALTNQIDQAVIVSNDTDLVACASNDPRQHSCEDWTGRSYARSRTAAERRPSKTLSLGSQASHGGGACRVAATEGSSRRKEAHYQA